MNGDINKYMEFNDADIYCDPHAYFQRPQDYTDNRRVRKVVFQEPYETMPNFYMDNNFKKGNCDCIPKPRPKEKNSSSFPFNFDIKSLMPLLANFTKGNSNMSSIFSLLTGLMNNNQIKAENFEENNENFAEKNENSGQNFDFSKIISMFLQNPTMLSGVMNMFSNKKKTPHKVSSTDVEIKDFVRVD